MQMHLLHRHYQRAYSERQTNARVKHPVTQEWRPYSVPTALTKLQFA